MLVTVLKPFPYAHDHITIRHLAEGDVVEIHDDLIEGLEGEGFIGEPPPAAPANTALVEIPAEWAKLQWFKLQALAKLIVGGPVANKVAAVEIIEAELARRAA